MSPFEPPVGSSVPYVIRGSVATDPELSTTFNFPPEAYTDMYPEAGVVAVLSFMITLLFLSTENIDTPFIPRDNTVLAAALDRSVTLATMHVKLVPESFHLGAN